MVWRLMMTVLRTAGALILIWPVSAFLVVAPVAAAGTNLELAPRLNLVGGSGRPSNDILGFGVGLQRRLDNGWHLGFNVDYSPEFDFEEPYRIVGVRRQSGTPVVDAVGTMLLLTVIGEKRHALERPGWSFFWNVGGGIADVDMDDADGSAAGGGSFDIETDAGTEFVLLGGVGLMQRLGDNWSARYEFTYEYHEGGWDVRDRVSGNTGEIDDYDIYGLRIGMSRRF